MKVKLTKNVFEYLCYSLIKKQELLQFKLKEITKKNQSVILEIDEATADEIRDWASEELQEKGFDINYKFTDEGKILIELIDLFYVA